MAQKYRRLDQYFSFNDTDVDTVYVPGVGDCYTAESFDRLLKSAQSALSEAVICCAVDETVVVVADGGYDDPHGAFSFFAIHEETEQEKREREAEELSQKIKAAERDFAKAQRRLKELKGE